jgi:3-hydroxyisobutyrate dehydrogenase-like beta-hydroxyacid dehydrogenase
MTLNCAWIGLGTMGFPMAGHLAKKSGAKMVVYNRHALARNIWRSGGANARRGSA